MATSVSLRANRSAYELRFQSLDGAHHSAAFPCDAQGHVDLNALDDQERVNYLFVRACIGRDYARPKVARSEVH